MEIPVDGQFLVINLEPSIKNKSAAPTVQNETNSATEESEATPSRSKPGGEVTTVMHKQGPNEPPQQQCSCITTLQNPYSGYYGEIFSYLMTKKFPDGAPESLKRILKRSCQYYCVIDGVLHYGHKNPKKVVSEKDEQKKILESVHIEEGTGVHRGAKKMHELINSSTFWRHLYADITNYIKECTKCVDYDHENTDLVVDHDRPVKHDGLHSKHIWEKIEVQILGPYPKTANRNEFVVAIVDPISQWIIAQPVAFDKSLASQIACLIFKAFCDFGFTRCTLNSVPPQLSSDVLSKLKKYENCLRKVTVALGQPVVASQICNFVKCQEGIVDCAWLNELFSIWVQENSCTWDKDLDEFLFEFRALPKNGVPSPFCSMFNRQPVHWAEDKENVLENNYVPPMPKRRKLQGTVMKCRHCDELFTSKMSFRIHQRKHTEEAKFRGLMEGEEPFKPVNHETIDEDHRIWKRSANKKASDPYSGNVLNVWKRLKKITSRESRTHVGNPQVKEEVQKQLRANAVAAVKNIILATKDTHKKRGKYQKYSQDIQEEMARYAIQHGILKTARHFSERLRVRVSHSTVRNIMKLHSCFTPQLKEEIGRFAAGFGVEAASRHFSERLGREVRQSLVRKFKKLYVVRFSESSGKIENDGHSLTVSIKHKSIFDEKLKEEIGKHACEAGIAATIDFFVAKHSLRLKESLIRRLRKQYLERNSVQTHGSHVPDMDQQKQNVPTEETVRSYQGSSNVVHTFYTDQIYQSAPQIQGNDHVLAQQNSAVHFNAVNTTTNSTSFLHAYQQVPSTTTSVIVNQDSISVPIFQQREHVYSSGEGQIIQGSVIPVPSNLGSVPPSHFQFQLPAVTTSVTTSTATHTDKNNEVFLQPLRNFQQISSSSAVTTERTLAAVHIVPSLPQKQLPQVDNSSPNSFQSPAVIHQNPHPNTIGSSYPAAVVQAVGEKVTVLSALENSANLMIDRGGTYTLATCLPAGEKTLYKPHTFHLPVSNVDAVTMAVCRDNGQTMNDVIITFVPSSENDKIPCKGSESYPDCHKVNNNLFLVEKEQQHVYQKQLNKQQSHISAQLQQQAGHFHDRQSHKQPLYQEHLQEQLQQQNYLNESQTLNVQQPLLREQQEKRSHKYKLQNSQQQESSQKLVYEQNKLQSHKPQQQVTQQQQNDCQTLQTQHQPFILLQTHLPQEQPQKNTQQNQQHSHHLLQHLLQQPLQLQDSQEESLQHLKKQHTYHPQQQQVFLLQPHLNQDESHKSECQQLHLLQQQPHEEKSKEMRQQLKQNQHEHQQQLIQVHQLVSCEQLQQSVGKHKQQPQKPQPSIFQLQLQLDLEQQKSTQHTHQSQIYSSPEQGQEPTEKQKQEHLHHTQHEFLQQQQLFIQRRPQKPVEQLKQQYLHESQHKAIQQQPMSHGQLPESGPQENLQHLHQSQHNVHLQSHLAQEQAHERTHQAKQHLHQSDNRVLGLHQQLVQEQGLIDKKKQCEIHQSTHEALDLPHLVQEQECEPTHQEKQSLLRQSQHQALQLHQQLDREPLKELSLQEKQRHLHQSQLQVLHVQKHLVQEQLQKSEQQDKQQHLHETHQLLHGQQKLDQKPPPVPTYQDKQQHLHQPDNILQLHAKLDQEPSQMSTLQEDEKHLHVAQQALLQQQFIQEESHEPADQENRQSLRKSQHHALNLQQHFHEKQQHLQLSSQHPTIQLQHHLSQQQLQDTLHKEEQQHLQQSHHTAFHVCDQLSQEQPQDSTKEGKQQMQVQQSQEPHQMLQSDHVSCQEQLGRQVNQEKQDQPHQLQPHLLDIQHQHCSEIQLHQHSLHSQQHESNSPKEGSKVEQPQQEQPAPTQESHQASHGEQQSEALPYMKLACTLEEESTNDPDEMVVYVSDANDSTQEGTAKDQQKNSPAFIRKCNDRKGKTGDNTSHKRGNYTLYSPELRAELGKYASEHGNQRAREYFRGIVGHDIPESTIRSLKDKYIMKCHLSSNAPGGINSVTSLGYSPRGRPLRLGKYDDIVKECIRDLMQSGAKISQFLAITTAKQVLMQYEPELLVENGGSIKLTNAWAKSFLKRIDVQHDT